ncbi:unnamed protein product [Paramecium octaurelia]|uniref:Uncharacterized protein n=1 Tax=Paramecium octaurelia TaxID=43137 RepID=A0A8S1TDS5_PAROT|nr:unnamed protein product [Paramecium octaurelia]
MLIKKGEQIIKIYQFEKFIDSKKIILQTKTQFKFNLRGIINKNLKFQQTKVIKHSQRFYWYQNIKLQNIKKTTKCIQKFLIRIQSQFQFNQKKMATNRRQAHDTIMGGETYNLQQNNFLDDPYCSNEQVIDNQQEYYSQNQLDPLSLSIDCILIDESYRKIEQANYQNNISATQF